jgi:hypothetical protein
MQHSVSGQLSGPDEVAESCSGNSHNLGDGRNLGSSYKRHPLFIFALSTLEESPDRIISL